MYDQEMYEGRRAQVSGCASCGPLAYASAYDDACMQARQTMCLISGEWCDASCNELYQKICKQDCTIFIGNHSVRLGLCGTPQCPAPGEQPGGGSSMVILGIVAVAAVAGLGIFLAKESSKKKLVPYSRGGA